MKNLILLLAVVALGCGGSIEKNPENSSPNNESNTPNNESNTPNNDSNIIIFTPNNANNASNTPNNINNEPLNVMNPVSCETRADCSTDQECVDTICTDHWSCNADGGPNGSGCETSWSCDDDKVYMLACDLFEDDFSMASCVCLVNDVAVAEFAGDAEPICDTDTTHRAVNENCGWLVPSFF